MLVVSNVCLAHRQHVWCECRNTCNRIWAFVQAHLVWKEGVQTVYNHLQLCSALDLCLLDCAGPVEVCQTVLCIPNMKLGESYLAGVLPLVGIQTHHRQGYVCTSFRPVMSSHTQVAF